FFFQAEDGIRDGHVTGVQTCALPISSPFSATRRAPAAWASPVDSGCRRSGLGIWSPSGPSARTRPRASKPLADSVQDSPGRGGRSEERRVGKGWGGGGWGERGREGRR